MTTPPSFVPPGPAYRVPEMYDPDEPRTTTFGRWQVQALALAVLLAVTLGVRWYDNSQQLDSIKNPRENIKVVPRGKPGTIAGVQLRMQGREGQDPVSKGPGASELRLVLEVKGAKDPGSAVNGLMFWLRDRKGREWSANANTGTGAAQHLVTVRATVPTHLARSLILDVADMKLSRRKSRNVPTLRFAH